MIQAVLWATGEMVLEAAPFIFIGFLAAGFIKSFLPLDTVGRFLRPHTPASVIYAALFGIPLPLCSCSVLPAAMALRKQGASRGATSAFIIATPESGVDSIATTYALMDPVMAVFRPLAAFATATLAGMLELVFGKDGENGAVEAVGCADCEPSPPKNSFTSRITMGITYAFGDLMREMAPWLTGGLILAGIISASLPTGFLERFSENEFVSMLVMLAAGIPMYVCASASTPIAAALMLKGLSPGAALVFLLSGPATNAASLVVLYRMFGRRSTIIYLFSIVTGALVMGFLLNRFYPALGLEPRVMAGAETAGLPAWLETATAILLCLVLARGIFQEWRARHAGHTKNL